MKLTLRNPAFAALLALAGVVGFRATADTLTNSLSFGPASFDYNTSLNFPLFDPSLGTLNSITFKLQGSVTSDQGAENLSVNSGGNVTLISRATMTLFRPDNTALVITIPGATNVFTATTFDGSVDFGGTSGASYSQVSTSSDLSVYSGASDLNLFTGLGTIGLPISAAGTSTANGSGTITSTFSTQGSTTATVIYDFSPTVVPEASTYGSIGAVAIIGFLGYRRSRKSAVQSN